MALYAVIRLADNIVANVVEWDGITTWQPDAGYQALLLTTGRAGPSDVWGGGQTFTPAQPSPVVLSRRQILAATGTLTAVEIQEAIKLLLGSGG